MLEIKGKINTAICYASVIEEEAIEQIRRPSAFSPCRKCRRHMHIWRAPIVSEK